MEKCFHFTKNRFLKSILRYGLRAEFGENCSIVGDQKGKKISYSVGAENAKDMYRSLYNVYRLIHLGRVKEETYDEDGRRAIREVQKSESFEEWEEPGVYLMFDGDCIEDSAKNETDPLDSYTNKTIPSNKLKVCIIKNRKTGEMFSSKYDVVCYWIAKSKEENFDWYWQWYGTRIKEFKSREFKMEYMELSKFCEMYLEILGEEGEIPIDKIGKIHSSIENKNIIFRIFDRIKRSVEGIFR